MRKAKSAPLWEAAFLAALVRTGNVRVSAFAAGIDYSTAYQRRQRDAGFRTAWAAVVKQRDEAGPGAGAAPPPSGCAGRPPSPVDAAPGAGAAPPPSGCAGRSPSPVNAGEELAVRASAEEELVVRASAVGAAPKLVRAGPGRWSAARERRFLAALAACANVRKAAEAAGVSAQALYARRLRDGGFRAAWDASIEVGRARLQALLIEAAERTFDPHSLPAPDEAALPRVSIAEAIHIVRLKGPAGGRDQPAEEAGAAAAGEYRAAVERIGKRLARLHQRDVESKRAAGWTEHGDHLIPPGWVRGEEAAS